MVYSNNFIVVVKCKCNCNILREKDGIVTLPFGSEYSLLIKNLDSRKVSANISIDGQDVMDGSLLLAGNTQTELEGFVKGNVAKNSFKFIQKTKQIQDHRGDRIDDGIIRVEFAFEKKLTEVIKKIVITEHHDRWYPRYYWFVASNIPTKYTTRDTIYYNSTGNVSECGNTTFTNSCDNQVVGTSMKSVCSVPYFDEGITVKGSEINQQFQYGSIGQLEQSEVIILRLRGEKSNGTIVKEPITVKTKLTCSTCGKTSKSSVKFCGECGTFLE